jgi:hypothetical protein
METGSEHAVDLLSLGISITGLAVKVVGKLALPYLLAWEVYKLIKDPITEAQKCAWQSLYKEHFLTQECLKNYKKK